jgi:tRNA(Ile)-lysidine synthase
MRVYTTTMGEDLVARVGTYVANHALIAPGDAIVVAVSGGADSLCLLHVLNVLAPILQCRLHVAHLDHALRDVSADDASYVAGQAAALGWPCVVGRSDVRRVARDQRTSVEVAARRTRYAFLRDVLQASGAAAIATGHTRDDQAETVLLHLLRGSGLNGLAGMRPKRGDVVRPLLEVSHAEASAHCAGLGLRPRDDSSNRSLGYRRNRLRHQALPLLDSIQPAAAVNIARSTRLIAADLALIERLARRALDGVTTQLGAGSVVLSLARGRSVEPELHPHMLRLLLNDLLGTADGFDEAHYALMARALDTDGPNVVLNLPRTIILERRTSTAVLGPIAEATQPVLESTLAVPGCVACAGGSLTAELAVAPNEWNGLSPHVAYLDRGAAGSELRVRAWRAGDRMQPLGLVGTRKLQDVFVDCKVPRALRSSIPIVEGSLGIAWVAGLRMGEPYRVSPGQTAVKVTWMPLET